MAAVAGDEVVGRGCDGAFEDAVVGVAGLDQLG